LETNSLSIFEEAEWYGKIYELGGLEECKYQYFDLRQRPGGQTALVWSGHVSEMELAFDWHPTNN
jgi:hypothetical protein